MISGHLREPVDEEVVGSMIGGRLLLDVGELPEGGGSEDLEKWVWWLEHLLDGFQEALNEQGQGARMAGR